MTSYPADTTTSSHEESELTENHLYHVKRGLPIIPQGSGTVFHQANVSLDTHRGRVADCVSLGSGNAEDTLNMCTESGDVNVDVTGDVCDYSEGYIDVECQ